MENTHKLFMLMLGCRPDGRFTEQHDIFFGIAQNLRELVPDIKAFWPEAKGNIHIDVWREVTAVGNYKIEVVANDSQKSAEKLFFINLGGYKRGEFDEYHYKVVVVAPSLAAATKLAKDTSFYKHFGFKGAVSHIDDKFGVDVDDVYDVAEILSEKFTGRFGLKIVRDENPKADELHIGYLKLDKIP